MELARNGVLDGEFGTPADGARPLLRVTAHVRTATFRWIGAAIGGYHDGDNEYAVEGKASLCTDQANLRCQNGPRHNGVPGQTVNVNSNPVHAAIDTDRYIGSGQYVLADPSLFDQEANRTNAVPKDPAGPAERAKAQEAAFLCPAQAISIKGASWLTQ
jgi:ferredoxin